MAIERQHWFMLREAKIAKYTVKIRSDVIQYFVNYNSVSNVYAFEANLNKTT